MEEQVPEYKRIQKQLKRLSQRGFHLKEEINKPGHSFRSLDGKDYYIARDGSWRRKKE